MKKFFVLLFVALSAFAACEIEEDANEAPDVPAIGTPINQQVDIAQTGTTLTWICTDPENDILVYDVYFGVENPPTIAFTALTTTEFVTGELIAETVYYWYIVATDTDGNKTESPVWSFTTGEADDPNAMPNTPTPEDGATGVALNGTLSWSCNNSQVNGYEVYMAPDGESLQESMLGAPIQTSISYSNLQANTKYWWFVVGRNGVDQQLNFLGAQWSFTTGSK